MEQTLNGYLAALEALFRNPNDEAARAWWTSEGHAPPAHPAVPLATIHKARLQWLDATDDMLAESRAFLFDHGYGAIPTSARTRQRPGTPRGRSAACRRSKATHRRGWVGTRGREGAPPVEVGATRLPAGGQVWINIFVNVVMLGSAYRLPDGFGPPSGGPRRTEFRPAIFVLATGTERGFGEWRDSNARRWRPAHADRAWLPPDPGQKPLRSAVTVYTSWERPSGRMSTAGGGA